MSTIYIYISLTSLAISEPSKNNIKEPSGLWLSVSTFLLHPDNWIVVMQARKSKS